MAATIDNRVAELERANAQLRRQLDACSAELKEAREQQTATDEVLQVINSSPGDLAPVFDAMLDRALRLCNAAYGNLLSYDGDRLHPVAVRGDPRLTDWLPRHGSFRPGPGTTNFRIIRGEVVVHVADAIDDEPYRQGDPIRRALVEIGQCRALLSVALRKDDALLGVIHVYRTEPHPFSEKQIALLQNFAAQAVIAIENARLITETREALEQQTATAEVLGVINSSPGELAPVFDAILEKAHTLCGAAHGSLTLNEGEHCRAVATRGMPEEFARVLRQPFHPGFLGERLSSGEPFVQIADITATPTDSSAHRAAVGPGRVRTLLAVPLRKDGALLGYITANRQEVRPFSDKQISLLQNFAAQAVIAMENARLLTETREALEQQTATAEVLQVINSSPGDLAPVFASILDKAHSLCDVAHGSLQLYDGVSLRAVATHGVSDAFADILRHGYRAADSPASRGLIEGRRFVQIADCAEIDHPVFQSAAELAGIRTVLFVPLRRDDALLGLISSARREVRPFSDKEIALLQNFAAQAVIAMENARLLTETREALERQAATAEVLGIIASSPGRLEPVFEAMLANAVRLCAGTFGTLAIYDEDGYRGVAAYGAPSSFPDTLSRFRHAVPGTTLDGLEVTLRTVQVADCTAEPAYDPVRAANPAYARVRSHLCAPLIKDNRLLGAILIYRDRVLPFDDKQIDLVENFAKQAVIAIENARLITETREALDQQTATAEVLQVINSSPGDLAPVFDAILEKAHSLCGVAKGSLELYDGQNFRAVATRGLADSFADELRQGYPASDNPATRPLIEGQAFTHILDRARHKFPFARRAVDAEGAHTLLCVPLRRDDKLLGMIAAARLEVRPFSDKQIALLQNFAAQAVIAIENARLLTETREALEQQTATAEVLQVINSSPGDLAPVFDAMLEKALRLCQAAFGMFWTYEGDRFQATALRGVPPAFAEFVREPLRGFHPGTGIGRLLRGEPLTIHLDMAAEEAYRAGDPLRRAIVDLGGARSAVTVALRKDETLLGAFTVYRREVRPFSDKQIALLQNFAAQAVIAMENARLLTETREALEQQTATAEVLQVINSSPGDLAPVFDAMLDKALNLCGAAFGILQTIDGKSFHTVAHRGVSPAFADFLAAPREVSATGLIAEFLEGARFVHRDAAAGEGYRSAVPVARALVELEGARTLLAVPLRKDATLVGTIVIYRREVRPFSEKEIGLLQNFAAQAVIAMENARLLTETREALEQQTATAEVLQVINSSPGDLAPVFDAMLDKAVRLCDFAFAALWTYDGIAFHPVALHGMPAAFEAYLREHTPPAFKLLHDSTGPIHFPDVMAAEMPQRDPEFARVAQQLGTVRTLLLVPLRKDAGLLGAFVAYRQEVRPFSDKQISLLQNFAAQAVIAMENARLLGELRERTGDLQESLEHQTATSEVLKVISRSGAELEPVLDTLVETAARICRAESGFIFQLHDGLCHMVASFGIPVDYKEFQARNPIAPGSGTLAGRVALERRAVYIEDAATDPEYTRLEAVQLGRQRTMLGVPLIREDALIGVITLARSNVERFTDKQIALVTTFADQAVIAIENARLLGDLQGRTHDLQESLEYQTATSDVLKVISQSGAELGPVLDTLGKTAARLCDAEMALIHRREDEVYRPAAVLGFPPEFIAYLDAHPLVPGRGSIAGRAAMERRAIHVTDVAADQEYELNQSILMAKQRTALGVPLLREGLPVGVIVLARSRVEPFSDKQIALVTTFADQAVIAIENARLFSELRARTAELGRSVEELKMLGEVGRAVSSTLDLRTVLSTILTASLGVTWANAGAVFRYSRVERAFRLVEAVGWDEALADSVRELRIAETESAMGEAVAHRRPIQLADLEQRPSYNPLRDATLAAGFHSALIVPLVGAERVFGAITLMRQEAGEFPAETVRLMQTLASQSVLAIQNARLFREIADKSEQLALASQHKSQFLANMSHELRTPLNAILGYAELLVDGIYGILPEKAQGVLERVQNNGKHLLALINDVLDLAKIEAGQLALTLEDYALAEVVRSVVTATEPLAVAKGLKFTAIVQDGMPMAHGDARRVSQVLLNLAGNAIKFTDAGEVEINASAANGQFLLTVRDTGPGIADADQERIFGEFQQIDNSDTRKKGGTGLGLAISKRMVEMQGGMISVDSVLGAGSTFRVVLPVHVEPALEEAA